MNDLLIHDLTAAMERDAVDLSSTDREERFTGSWSFRREGSAQATDAEAMDEHLERALERLRMGPPSWRR